MVGQTNEAPRVKGAYHDFYSISRNKMPYLKYKEKKPLPVSQFKGLYVDGMTIPGGLSEAENIDILANGWAKRRLPTRTLAETLTVKASQGFKELTEFRNAAGNRFLFADLNISTTMKIQSGAVTGTTDYEVSWADVITGLTAGTSILPQYATMQDYLFRVDGTNAQYAFSTNAAYTNNGVTAPSAAPTVSSTTGGSLTPGEYNVYYTYVKKIGTYVVESNPCPVANITIAGTAINITIVSSADTGVTHVRLYRTIYGLPDGVRYYDKEIAKATYVATPIQAFTNADTIADAGITLEVDNSVPPTSIGLTCTGNRMFYLTKTAVYWSKIEEPEHVPATWYSPIDPNDSDIGMAIASMQNYVLVFKRRKTFMYDANSATVIDGTVGIGKHIISTKIGCRATNSVQSCGEQNCIIWLSHEGVMKWSGGEIENISKDRVNSIIDSIIETANSEYFVDSAYYGKKYHLLLVARNSGSTLITDQRHLVYNFETDSWTEYKYYGSDGTRYYETNLAVTTDSNKKDMILIAVALTTGATSTYIYQSEYGTNDSGLIMDGDGDGSTPLADPGFTFADSLDNVYIISGRGNYSNSDTNIFKVTSAGTKSLVASTATLRTSANINSSWSMHTREFHVDVDNDCFYLLGYSAITPQGTHDVYTWIIKVTFTGVCTLIAKCTHSYCNQGDSIISMDIGLAGTVLFYSKVTNPVSWYDPNTHYIYKVTNPGGDKLMGFIMNLATTSIQQIWKYMVQIYI